MANPKTPGDLSFEQYCDLNGYLWSYEPGRESLGVEPPTKPDYLIERGGDRAVVEVKRFTTMRETEKNMASPSAAGVPMRTLQEWMGHRDLSTTQRYADYAPSTREAEMVAAAFAYSNPRRRSGLAPASHPGAPVKSRPGMPKN